MSDSCVLDTQAWVRNITAPAGLPPRARRLLKRCTTHLVPAFSLYEVALLVARGRLVVADPGVDPTQWMMESLAAPCELTAITPAIATSAVDLLREGFHRDPADSLIYATARTLELPLITNDRKIHAFEERLPRKSLRLAVWD